MGTILAVVSGKGGTGKTSLCAAIACHLAREGQRVLCIDADVGLRNLDISLGMAREPVLPFTNVMSGEYPLSSAAVHPEFSNLSLLTAPVTVAPEAIDRAAFADLLAQAREQFDWCLIDAPAGIGAGFRLATDFADQVLVVTGGDPAALRDGQRTAQGLSIPAKLAVNRIQTRFFRRTRFTVDDCMDQIGLPLLGIVPEDEAVALCAATGKALAAGKLKGANLACRNMAWRLIGKRAPIQMRL